MSFEYLLERNGQKFDVYRDGEFKASVVGMNAHDPSGAKIVAFMPETDVKVDDWLVNSVGERLLVTDTATAMAQGKPHRLRAYYQSEAEVKRSQKSESAAIFNIGNAYGSIIGNNNIATMNYQNTVKEIKERVNSEPTSEDTEALKEIVTQLELILSEQVPVRKGAFSKFADVLARHSWLSGAIASALFQWLSSLIP